MMSIETMNTSKVIIFLFLFSVFFLFNFSCQSENEEEKIIKVNFSKRDTVYSEMNNVRSPLRAAVSAMISPKETFSYYSKIFDYVSSRIDRRILFKQRKSYQEVNELLRLRELDFAFICSGAYIEAKEQFNAEILVVPKIKGKTTYHAYIIVRDDSSIEHFDDLKGHSFAFTDPLSNTGCLYPRYLVKKMNQSLDEFFSSITFTYAHDYSIHAVEQELVIGASVDSLIFDYIQSMRPQEVSRLKIIHKSESFGIPPVVVHPEIMPRLKEELRSIFLNMSSDPEGKDILSQLDIERFVLSQDKEYDSIRRLKAFIH